MQIVQKPIQELRPYPNNARTHSKKQITQIAKSISKFGFCNPVLVDDSGQILAGHGRVEAAKLLGIDTVPTCRLSHLSDAEKCAYVLADNRLAERAGWDRDYPVRCCLAVTPASTAVSRRNTYVQEGRTALQDFWCA